MLVVGKHWAIKYMISWWNTPRHTLFKQGAKKLVFMLNFTKRKSNNVSVNTSFKRTATEQFRETSQCLNLNLLISFLSFAYSYSLSKEHSEKILLPPPKYIFKLKYFKIFPGVWSEFPSYSHLLLKTWNLFVLAAIEGYFHSKRCLESLRDHCQALF